MRERSTHSDRERHVRDRCTHTHTHTHISATLLHHISLAVSKETERDMCERDTMQERAIPITELKQNRGISEGDRERCHRKRHLSPSHLCHIRQRQMSAISDRETHLCHSSQFSVISYQKGRDVYIMCHHHLAIEIYLSLT